jgi:SsrA-binding protein
MKSSETKLILKNKKAYFNYEILETLEAGLVLLGSEIKSIRENKVSIQESYARPEQGEFYIYNMDISPYKYANVLNHEPKRTRKLLLNKKEIRWLIGKTQEKGLTVIPLKLYLKNGFAKLELGLARGKKLYDKRLAMKKKETSQEIARALSPRHTL